MEMTFAKWEGTGNDFIVLDDRAGRFPTEDRELIQRLCHRHLGIGSDGILLIQTPRSGDEAYQLDFLNPDGSRSFCGNGSRCGFAFWRKLMGEDPMSMNGVHVEAAFMAIDGRHHARMADFGVVAIDMRVSPAIEHLAEDLDLLDTGSPHLLVWVEDPEQVDLLSLARGHRYGPRFARSGVNVNAVAIMDGQVRMRTYERGVEDETLSCGTGVTAAAVGAVARGLVPPGRVPVGTRGGDLWVEVPEMGDGVELAGPVREVYTGNIFI
ncbi:MAG: diaminopimelate epimerase [Flavobacteriales bacterium]|nr:diaminopimelate epimerase [Flavobacteriales bacterium]